MMKIKILLWSLLCALLLTSCGSVTPIPTPIPSASPLPVKPTATPIAVKPWPGMKPGWTVYHATAEKSPYLTNSTYDPAGYIWAAGEQSIYRWEIASKKMDRFQNPDLLFSNIQSMVSFDGKIWVATIKGDIATFDGEQWASKSLAERISVYFSKTQDQLWAYSADSHKRTFMYEDDRWVEFKNWPENKPLDVLASSKNGLTWFRGQDGAVYSFDGNKWASYPNISWPINIFIPLKPGGKTYFILQNFIVQYDGQSFKTVVLPDDIYIYNIRKALQTSTDDIWISIFGDDQYAYQIDPNGSVKKIPYMLSKKQANNLWVSSATWTPQGLLTHIDRDLLGLYQDGKTTEFRVPSVPEDVDVLGDLIKHRPIGFMPDGSLLLVTGDSLKLYDGQHTLDLPCGKKGDVTDAVKKDFCHGYTYKINARGEIWGISTLKKNNEVVRLVVGQNPVWYYVNMPVEDIDFAADGSVWIINSYGESAHLALKDLVEKKIIELHPIPISLRGSSEDVREPHIAVFPDGKIWALYKNHRYEPHFFVYDGLTGWKFVGTLYYPETVYTDFQMTSKNEVWIATRSSLMKTDGKTWRSYPHPDIFLRSMTLSADGALWFVNGDEGVGRFDGTTWTDYTTELHGAAPNQISLAPDGALWFFSGDVWVRYQASEK